MYKNVIRTYKNVITNINNDNKNKIPSYNVTQHYQNNFNMFQS